MRVGDVAAQIAVVVGSDGTVEQRPVKLGQSRDGLIAVTEGVKPGELVIIEGLQKVRKGAKVTAKVSDALVGGEKP